MKTIGNVLEEKDEAILTAAVKLITNNNVNTQLVKVQRVCDNKIVPVIIIEVEDNKYIPVFEIASNSEEYDTGMGLHEESVKSYVGVTNVQDYKVSQSEQLAFDLILIGFAHHFTSVFGMYVKRISTNTIEPAMFLAINPSRGYSLTATVITSALHYLPPPGMRVDFDKKKIDNLN
jgi:hypothetical protein